MMPIDVIDTGVANIASMLAALERLGCAPRLTRSPEDVHKSARVVLPGVGAFEAGMGRLSALGLVEPLRDRLGAGKPTLCVCLGLQLLARDSEEDPGVAGLGILDAHVVRFRSGAVRVPQLGWNEVTPHGEGALLQAGYAYFANSYHLDRVPTGWRGAMSDHGEVFVAAIERGAQLACQFHPELSGPWGLALMGRWLAAAQGWQAARAEQG